MGRTLLAVAAICAAAFSAPSEGEAQTRGLGRLIGSITSDAGAPLEGAVVRITVADGAIEGRTDGNGRWTVVGVGKGQFTVEFSKDGFETKRVKLTVERESMQPAPIKISLKKSA